MALTSAEYWNQRYLNDNTPWDIGQVSPPIKAYIDKYIPKDAKILIPGAGRAHEAIYMFREGYQEGFVCDWAPEAFHYLQGEVPTFPKDHLIQSDFFQLEGQYDFILEQTFFCAINPSQRLAYINQINILLKPGGWVAGLLFNRTFTKEGPPFGGSKDEYESLFSCFFSVYEILMSHLSIEPRMGFELFFSAQKRPII